MTDPTDRRPTTCGTDVAAASILTLTLVIAIFLIGALP